MHSFITQFRKANNEGMKLIYDRVNVRYLVTHKTGWENWDGCVLVKKFIKDENK